MVPEVQVSKLREVNPGMRQTETLSQIVAESE